jgi:hypothetical protein
VIGIVTGIENPTEQSFFVGIGLLDTVALEQLNAPTLIDP